MMQHTHFCRYDLSTGRPFNAGHCSVPDYLLQTLPGSGLIDQPCDLSLDYVDLTGEPYIRRRPTIAGFDKLGIVADGVDAATLSLPIPFVITVDGVSHVVNTADDVGAYTVTLDSAMPASYAVTVEAWPYLDYKAEIVAS